MSLFKRWQILSITYRDYEHTSEYYRLLYSWPYMTRKGAEKEVRRCEYKDSLEGNRKREYRIIEAF